MKSCSSSDAWIGCISTTVKWRVWLLNCRKSMPRTGRFALGYQREVNILCTCSCIQISQSYQTIFIRFETKSNHPFRFSVLSLVGITLHNFQVAIPKTAWKTAEHYPMLMNVTLHAGSVGIMARIWGPVLCCCWCFGLKERRLVIAIDKLGQTPDKLMYSRPAKPCVHRQDEQRLRQKRENDSFQHRPSTGWDDVHRNVNHSVGACILSLPPTLCPKGTSTAMTAIIDGK